MDKKNIIIIVLTVLIIIASTVLIVKIIDKEKPDTVIERNDKYNVFDLSECESKACEKKFSFLGNDLVVQKENAGGFKIIFNDYEIYASASIPYIGNAIYTFQDDVLFPIKDEDKNIKIMKYSIGKYEAEQLSLEQDDAWYVKSISSKDNVLTINTSKFIREDTMEYTQAFIDIKSCNEFSEFSGRDVEKVFEVVYKDGAFSKPKEVSSKKLSEISKYSSLCATN